MDPAGVGVLIGIGTMVGGLFACYLHERCVFREGPEFRPLVVPRKARFTLRQILPKSSTSHHTQYTSQTSSSARPQTESA